MILKYSFQNFKIVSSLLTISHQILWIITVSLTNEFNQTVDRFYSITVCWMFVIFANYWHQNLSLQVLFSSYYVGLLEACDRGVWAWAYVCVLEFVTGQSRDIQSVKKFCVDQPWPTPLKISWALLAIKNLPTMLFNIHFSVPK